MSEAPKDDRFWYEFMSGWASWRTQFRVECFGAVNAKEIDRMILLLQAQRGIFQECGEDEAKEKAMATKQPPSESSGQGDRNG